MKKEDLLKAGVQALFNGTQEPGKQMGKIEVTPEEIQREKEKMILEDESTPEEEKEALLKTIQDRQIKRLLKQKKYKITRAQAKTREQGFERVTNILSTLKMDKIRYISRKEGLPIKDILDACLDVAIEGYESKHGEITFGQKPVQKEKPNAKEVLFSKK